MAYIVFEIFALIWKILPPNIWAAFVVFGWSYFSHPTVNDTGLSNRGGPKVLCRWVHNPLTLRLAYLVIYRIIRAWVSTFP